MGTQGHTGVYKGVQWYNRGLHGYTCVYKGIQGYTKEIQGFRYTLATAIFSGHYA